jgi:5,10-methylenetetrahydromethanopterin reductase
MKLAAAFATSLATPEHVRIAEQLGYARAWLYDTPQQSPDVWLVLGIAATQTESIELGPGVLVPTLRHPMVNAAGAAALQQLAPGRTAVAFGTGYTGRRALGQPKPIAWSYMERYISAFRGLLRGDTVEWDGATMRMLHTSQSAPPFPIEIPIYIAALGPKGVEVARALGDGIFASSVGIPEGASNFDHVAYLTWGTILDDDEDITSTRVRNAAGPGLMQTYHGAYEISGAETTAALPGGREWLEIIDQVSANERHLAVHEGHCLHLNDADSAAWDAGAHALAETFTLSGTAADVRMRVAALVEQGVMEIVYQPAGDIAHELETFAAALSL